MCHIYKLSMENGPQLSSQELPSDTDDHLSDDDQVSDSEDDSNEEQIGNEDAIDETIEWDSIRNEILSNTHTVDDHIIWTGECKRNRPVKVNYGQYTLFPYKWLYLNKYRKSINDKLLLNKTCDEENCISPDHWAEAGKIDWDYMEEKILRTTKTVNDHVIWTGSIVRDTNTPMKIRHRGHMLYPHIWLFMCKYRLQPRKGFRMR